MRTSGSSFLQHSLPRNSLALLDLMKYTHRPILCFIRQILDDRDVARLSRDPLLHILCLFFLPPEWPGNFSRDLLSEEASLAGCIYR